MSDTPMTDKLSSSGEAHYLMGEHARNLERELAKAQAELAEARGWLWHYEKSETVRFRDMKAELEVLREQNFAMNKTIARMRPVVAAAEQVMYAWHKPMTTEIELATRKMLAITVAIYEAGEKP